MKTLFIFLLAFHYLNASETPITDDWNSFVKNELDTNYIQSGNVNTPTPPSHERLISIINDLQKYLNYPSLFEIKISPLSRKSFFINSSETLKKYNKTMDDFLPKLDKTTKFQLKEIISSSANKGLARNKISPHTVIHKWLITYSKNYALISEVYLNGILTANTKETLNKSLKKVKNNLKKKNYKVGKVIYDPVNLFYRCSINNDDGDMILPLDYDNGVWKFSFSI